MISLENFAVSLNIVDLDLVTFYFNCFHSPRREYFATEQNSPPEPEDDYVAEELPSMAMDGGNVRKDGEHDDDDVFSGPPEKRKHIDHHHRYHNILKHSTVTARSRFRKKGISMLNFLEQY